LFQLKPDTQTDILLLSDNTAAEPAHWNV